MTGKRAAHPPRSALPCRTGPRGGRDVTHRTRSVSNATASCTSRKVRNSYARELLPRPCSLSLGTWAGVEVAEPAAAAVLRRHWGQPAPYNAHGGTARNRDRGRGWRGRLLGTTGVACWRRRPACCWRPVSSAVRPATFRSTSAARCWRQARSDGEPEPVTVALLGSNLGNTTPEERDALLAEIAATLRPGDRFLVSADLQKPAEVLGAFYNDPLDRSAFARFRLNHLTHLNRRFGADFALEYFFAERGLLLQIPPPPVRGRRLRARFRPERAVDRPGVAVRHLLVRPLRLIVPG
ncbi:MAG: L-histidine N(alpha)-methyltransferase [Pseudonocardiaceae bacterium]